MTRSPGLAHLAAAALAALAGLAPLRAHAGTPPWFAALRSAAVARARAPLHDEVLTAAEVEVSRAGAAGLPQLRLGERSRLGLDGSYALDLEAGVTLPLWAPAAGADRDLTGERLAATRRQLQSERRAELRDALAQAVSLVASEARLGALDALAAALVAVGPAAAVAPPLRLVDVRLLAAGRSAQRRRAEALRRSLEASLGVPLPAPEIGAADLRAGIGARRAALDPLGFPVVLLEPARCVAASDGVTLARLAQEDARLSSALMRARARPRADLDIGGAVRLGSDGPAPSYVARVGVSVRLPPWGPATGAASLAVGAGGLEQALSARWPNPAPAAPPGKAASAEADDPLDDAVRTVRQQLGLLIGRESDLLERRRLLLDALSRPHAPSLTAAYQRATLRLQLADAEEALGLTRLDAALLCGALPP